ncbi:MAG: hypothetical protein A3J27_04465 [Candidatus Tectomicrobia bacterium RIFCSPLOWO2_12_FULL_69_37]|nr:MAG: hypothetical protein A3J27_04465 [Candidatus Tectomicrobia bacterium RIFCSPLOWO2_12_FULL_69_37]
MPNEFTAVVEQDEGWFIAYCPEFPWANGQGKDKAEALQNLSEAIALILLDRGEQEIAAGIGHDLDFVLAEADAILKKK